MTHDQLKQDAMEYLAKIFKGETKDAITAFVVQAAVSVALSNNPAKE